MKWGELQGSEQRIVKGIEVVSAELPRKEQRCLTVTERGLGKRTKIEEYRVQGRGGKGVISIQVIEKAEGGWPHTGARRG